MDPRLQYPENASMANNIKLTYFNTTGRAELSRLILAYAGVDFNDERVNFEEFAAMKPSLPNGQLPILSFNGTVLTQSVTMARLLANEYNLAGRNNLERAQADEIVDTVQDLMNATIPPIRRAKDDAEKAVLIAKLVEKCTEVLPKLSARFESRGGQYFAGNALTWADICFYQFFDRCKPMGVSLDSHPRLKDLSDRVANLPNIKKWVENPPKGQM